MPNPITICHLVLSSYDESDRDFGLFGGYDAKLCIS
jgi:hypothetical protein